MNNMAQSLIDPFLDLLWWLLPAAVIISFIKSPYFKGKFGEFMVNTTTKLSLDKEKYHLIKDVTLLTEDGTTQIDHIIVSPYGVFVIETKNMAGWIFGGERQKQWMQKFRKKSFKFQNPLLQNYRHTETIRSMLNLNRDQLHSVVAFVGDSTFKTSMPENVCQGAGYIKYIRSKKKVVLDEIAISMVVEVIEDGRLERGMKTDRAHIKGLRERFGK